MTQPGGTCSLQSAMGARYITLVKQPEVAHKVEMFYLHEE